MMVTALQTRAYVGQVNNPSRKGAAKLGLITGLIACVYWMGENSLYTVTPVNIAPTERGAESKTQPFSASNALTESRVTHALKGGLLEDLVLIQPTQTVGVPSGASTVLVSEVVPAIEASSAIETFAEALPVISEPIPPLMTEKRLRLQSGQGLIDLLLASGVTVSDAYGMTAAMSTQIEVSRLPSGLELMAFFDPQGEIQQLKMPHGFEQWLTVDRHGGGFNTELSQAPVTTVHRRVTGQVSGSLYLSAQQAGLPHATIAKYINVLSYEVDFQRQIRTGDHFEILYQTLVSEDGLREKAGDVLFAGLRLNGEQIDLYRFPEEGSDDYFHDDGRSIKSSLMKTPIDGARLSSTFGRRKHPVLGYTRMHKGLDFGAPVGTPVKASGDGVVERASYFGSFGNYVRIRHQNGYHTIYAHMSRYGKGIKVGRGVKQGEVIGYVGATGRVNGRHLHYEVHKNGKAVDPLSLKVTSDDRLKGDTLNRFKAQVAIISKQRNLG